MSKIKPHPKALSAAVNFAASLAEMRAVYGDLPVEVLERVSHAVASSRITNPTPKKKGARTRV